MPDARLNGQVPLNRQFPNSAARSYSSDNAPLRGQIPYVRKILSPLTLICSAGSGMGAGPATTAPVVMLYWLPWQGQSMVPLLTWLTMQPMCVQTALNALNSLAVGWVTTTLGPVKIVPPPTGMSLVAASAFAAAAPLGALPAAWPAGVLAAGVLPEPPALQAVITPARPTSPTPASTPRRVASDSACAPCVTTAPFPLPNGRRYRGTLPSLFSPVGRNGGRRCL